MKGMGSKKLIKALCILFSCFMIFSTSFAAEAQSVSSLKSEKEKIQSKLEQQQKKLDALEDNISNNQTYVNELVKKVDLLQDKLDNLEDSKAAIQSEINSVQSDIDNTQAQIDAAQKEIEAKEKEFESIYQQYCQRLRAMYISGNVSTLEVLLESGDISSVLTRSEMVKCVSKQDNATLDTLMKKMQEIQNEKQEMEKDKLKLEEDKKTLTQRKADLQASINDYNSSKQELDAEVSKANSAIKSLKSDKAEMQEAISANKNEIKQIDADISAALNSSSANKPGNSNYTPGTGQLGYPTSYHSISAGYPNYSGGRYHGGVDFPCPVGTAVHAADSGVVVIAKSLNYSYGHYIVIDHGNGLSTLYAHNSTLCVSVGQSVSKGQVIAYSGQTGNATGPHCHFEVRKNGTRVNPMSYL